MRNLFILFLSFSFFITPYIKGQNKAVYKEKFVEGNYLLLEENYPKALENFLAAYNADSNNANINYLVGLCYLKSATAKEKSLPYLQRGAKYVSEKYTPFEVREKNSPVTVYYYLGQAYHLTYQIDSALKFYNAYKSFLNPDKQADILKNVNRQIEMCNNAKEFLALPTSIKITNLGDSVNSPYPDYSPVITADESILIFTSRRPGSTGDERTDDEQFFEDIYYCYRKPDGTWSSPIPIGSNINTSGHEATIGLTADGYQLFIYKDDNGDGNIYSSTLEGDTWSSPVKLGSNINTPAWEPSACLTPDGSTLYFVSDRKGGYGGRDMYKCVRLPNGEWSLATNLGPTVNTEYDEDAPFIHPDRVTLFFSSNGHNSMGGFDIFYTTKTDSGWTVPSNLLPPINTPDDDIFYASSTDGKRAYFSSAGKDSYGDKDIYMVSLDETKVSSVALIIGRIIPVEGKPLPKELEITITNTETGETGQYKANVKSGKYVLPLMPGKNYSATYTIAGEEFYTEDISVPIGSGYQEIEKEIYLDPIKLKESLEKILEKQTTKKPEEKVIASSITETPVTTNNKTPDINEKIVEKKKYEKPVYKVQVSSVKKPALYDAFKGIKNIEYRTTENGWYVYYKGTFNTIKEAKILAEEIKSKGFSDAFVVPFSGELLPFDDTPPAKSSTNNNTSQLTSVTEKQFEMFFKYNITDINTGDANYQTFVTHLLNTIQSKGSVTVSLVSSASQVPTRSYNSNRELAADRANKTKNKLIESLKEKGIDSSKLVFKNINSSVNGPTYNDDYLINKSTYEKYQYVRITID